MIFDGSRVSIRPGSLQSTKEYDQARANILHYDAQKDRYALQLIHPEFNGKKMLCRRDALDFHFAALQGNLEAAKAELRQRSIAFQDRDGFLPSTRTTGADRGSRLLGRLGKALVAQRSYESGDVVLVDAPFLVVSNPDGLERWIRRWDCYYEIMKMAQSGQRELLDSFEAMDDGGEDVVQSLSADAGQTLKLLWQAAGSAQQSSIPEAVKEREKMKVARGFARWQTNQHEFPAFSDQQRRALYWLAPKVAHSCDPNVGWEDPAEDGRVELRALRRIASGEVLGVNYMNESFLLQPVEVRRAQLLRERKFHCVCQRCVSEPEPGSKKLGGSPSSLPREPSRSQAPIEASKCEGAADSASVQTMTKRPSSEEGCPGSPGSPGNPSAVFHSLHACLQLLGALQKTLRAGGLQDVSDALQQLEMPRMPRMPRAVGEEPLPSLVEQLNSSLREGGVQHWLRGAGQTAQAEASPGALATSVAQEKKFDSMD